MQRKPWVSYGCSSQRELRQDGAESEGDRKGSSIHLETHKVLKYFMGDYMIETDMSVFVLICLDVYVGFQDQNWTKISKK